MHAAQTVSKMPKKRKSTKQREDDANTEVADRKQPIEALDAMNDLKKSWPADVDSIFSVDMEQVRLQCPCQLMRPIAGQEPSPKVSEGRMWLIAHACLQQRRQELWEMVIDSAVSVCDRFAWATPDERSFRVLNHFSPIIEIGAGAGAP